MSAGAYTTGIQTRNFCVLLLLVLSVLCACKRTTKTDDLQEVPAAKVTASSREYMPVNGGQTITLPRLMEDAYVLWAPLTKREKSFHSHMPLDQRVMRWLPTSEKEIMWRYVDRLSRTQRSFAQKVLKRAEDYLPGILEELKKQNLPPELACLPLVESAFEARAVSRAGAAGLWQLMPQTARRYGLVVSEDIDERFHVPKATKAAISYLAFLYKTFNDWPLALAAYNCGEGAMRRALERSNSSSLNELSLASRKNGLSPPLLVEETVYYVPKFAAACMVMAHSKELQLTDYPLLANEPLSKELPMHPKLSLKGENTHRLKEPAPPKSRKIQ
jgi:membrane-bound lytic murein transglycosylase D